MKRLPNIVGYMLIMLVLLIVVTVIQKDTSLESGETTNQTKTLGNSKDVISFETKPFDPAPTIDLTELARLVNAERAKNYLSQLQYDPLLNLSAQEKCDDMVTRDYWSHNAPDGTEPWVFVQRHNVYKKAGENLAYGYYTAKDMVAGWMNSPTHRDNILLPAYNHVGYAQCEYPITSKQGNRTLVVQFFTD